MSRNWREYEYLDSDNFWCYIDEQSSNLIVKSEDQLATKTESYKMYILGQKDMLDKIADYLHENEKSLGDIAEIHELISKWDAIEKENLDADRAWDQSNIFDKE